VDALSPSGYGARQAMTIGFLLNTCEPFYRGGYERRAWAFARELARQGHDVRIYTSCPRNETIDGVRFVRLARPRRFFNTRGVREGTADILFALATLRMLRLVETGELDVLDVCATPFVHLPLVRLGAKVRGFPFVLTCHEALLAALPDYARERGHGQGFAAALTSSALGGIYRFGTGLFPFRLAVSRRTADALAAEGYPSFVTIEFGLEPEALTSQPPEPRPSSELVRLIYCGRLTPIKSVAQTLEALLPLRGQTARPFHLDIVGEGSERPRLEQTVAEAKAGDAVTFHGEVSEARKRELLARADVFVLASPREGFSVATLEALAQGCAALVVSDPDRPNGVLDFVRAGREGLCVAPGVENLRAGLRRLIDNAAEREAFRQAAWTMAQSYRVDEQARRLLAAYELRRKMGKPGGAVS
jgi:glycosyltransferase involved in cell wall biosynthesis